MRTQRELTRDSATVISGRERVLCLLEVHRDIADRDETGRSRYVLACEHIAELDDAAVLPGIDCPVLAQAKQAVVVSKCVTAARPRRTVCVARRAHSHQTRRARVRPPSLVYRRLLRMRPLDAG